MAAFLAAALVLRATPLAAQAEVTVDPGVRHQTMTGWEVTADLLDHRLPPLAPEDRERLMQRLADEVGVNRIRLEVRAGAETATGRVSDFIAGRTSFEDWSKDYYTTENDNDDPFDINWDGFDFAELDWHVEVSVLPLREALAAQGERLHVNLCYVAFRHGWYYQIEPEEYAELTMARSRRASPPPASWRSAPRPASSTACRLTECQRTSTTCESRSRLSSA